MDDVTKLPRVRTVWQHAGIDPQIEGNRVVNPADLAAFIRVVIAQDRADERECTCHPDDDPPRPCPRKFAISLCREAAQDRAPEVGPAEFADALEALNERDRAPVPPPAPQEAPRDGGSAASTRDNRAGTEPQSGQPRGAAGAATAPQEAPGADGLVDRLRALVDDPRRPWIRTTETMREAAAALNRLAADLAAARATIADLRDACDEKQEIIDSDKSLARDLLNAEAERDAARAEAAGLREALSRIYGMVPCFDAKGAVSGRIADIARAALSATPASADPRVPGLRYARQHMPLMGMDEAAAQRVERWLDKEMARLGAREGA